MSVSKAKPMLAAAIYIGSNSIQLKICENRSGILNEIDYLEQPLHLGQDTFAKGKISFDKAEKVGEIIKAFFHLIDSYKIKDICIVATTALRDAENKDYILDQIRIKTGKTVSVLDDAEEKELIYKEMMKKLDEETLLQDESALMAYIGTGSLGVSFYRNNAIPFTLNIRIGSLKLNEIMEKMQEHANRSATAIEEYLSTFTNTLSTLLPEKKARFFIASGEEMDLIARLCGGEKNGKLLHIPKEKFLQLYEEIRNNTADQIAALYDLGKDDAEMLLAAMSIYYALFEFTEASFIIDPPVSLLDALLFNMLFTKEAKDLDTVFISNTVLAARMIGEKYKYDRLHAEAVETYALQIFDQTKKLHGLGNRERLLLQVAAILHDSGKFVNTKGHYLHSYFIIKNSDIIGLNSRELEIAAHVAMYHGKEVPSLYHESYSRLLHEQRAVVSKLVALIRIGDALDRSHRQKFGELQITLKKDRLTILGSTYRDTTLEQWTFVRKGKFFQDVYGMKAEFKRKSL